MTTKARPRLFIGSSSESLRVAQILQQQLNPEVSVTIWNQGIFNLSEYTLNDLLEATKEFDFGLFIIGADDTIEIRGQRFLIGRDNVIFELGLFIGQLGKKRNFLVVQRTEQKLHLPSDLLGLNTTEFIWNENIPLSKAPSLDLHSSVGPSTASILQAIYKVGFRNEVHTSLSGGMVYLAICLNEKNHSFDALLNKLVDFETSVGGLKAPKKDKSIWQKLTKYACQCLEANGIISIYGGDEFKLTNSGRKIITSEEMKAEFKNVFDIFDSLKRAPNV